MESGLKLGHFVQLIVIRSGRPEVFCKKGVLRNLTKLTGKHLCQSLFFNKVTPFYTERLWWLLLCNTFSFDCPLRTDTVLFHIYCTIV